MTISWVRPEPPDLHDCADDTAALVEALGRTLAIGTIPPSSPRPPGAGALHVYELADTPAHQAVWPHLLAAPGVLLLRDASLQASRADALWQQQQVTKYVDEFTFDHGVEPPPVREGATRLVTAGWPMLRAPLLASRLVVVRDRAFEHELRRQYPDAAIRWAPIGVRPPAPAPRHDGPLRVGILDSRGEGARQTVARAARRHGLEPLIGGPREATRVVGGADVMVVLDWPARAEPPIAALVAMAAGRPTIVLETGATAAWPALDPQSWRDRGRTGADRPVVVSVDPRDEEHSVSLALRRLAADQALRETLGDAARAWWQANATVELAAEAWEKLIAEATTVEPPARPAEWPAHLGDRARAL